MKLLITGGLGFIGSNFIRYVLYKYPTYEIVNLDKITYAGNPENLKDLEKNPRYKFVKGDICDAKLVNSLIKEVDGIIHFAAESHVDRSISSSTEFVRTNVIGTQVLLDAALRNGNKRFHYIGTDEVYGHLGSTGKFSEESPLQPRSAYSASKAGAEHLVRAFFHTHNLSITISSCCNNYGPYQNPEKLLPLFITNLIEGKKVPLMGKGENVREWLHVLDHCEAIDLIYHQGKIGETYCVGSGQEKTNWEITHFLLDAFGAGEEMINPVPHRKGHDFRYAVDWSKLKNELGWIPRYSFEEGLRDTIRWYKENETWWKPLKPVEGVKVKGVILAGGSGSWMMPCTKVTNKHLLPVYNKPMIYYPLRNLIKDGIKEIMIVSGRGHAGHFLNLLDSGKEHGIKLQYEVQEGAGGIAEALALAKDFIGNDNVMVVLGDNVFEDDVKEFVEQFKRQGGGSRIFLKPVDFASARRFGIATVDETGKVTYVEEKPKNPKSNLAMTGLYLFDAKVFEFIKGLKRSARGELELTDAIDCYLQRNQLHYNVVEGFWSDAGTFESLHRSSNYVEENQDQFRMDFEEK